jgi:hypothetical protein
MSNDLADTILVSCDLVGGKSSRANLFASRVTKPSQPSSITEIEDDVGPPPLDAPTPSAALISNEPTVGINLHSLIGYNPSSPRLQTILSRLASDAKLDSPPQATVKSFSDSVYFSYHSIGISLIFQPREGYKLKNGMERIDLADEKLRLASIDVYNHEAKPDDPKKSSSTSSTKPVFNAFPSYPLLVSHKGTTPMLITSATLGKDFTNTLGEADRKGGGEGSMGIWTEWIGVGIMTEFASGGLKAWDEGGEATWKVLTVFERGDLAGKDDDEEVIF